jgi:biopolymer transport protein TolQ
MMLQKFFHVAQTGADAILWLLVALSVLSIAMIFERLFTLRRIKHQSQKVNRQVRDILHSYNLNEIEELSKDRESMEGRALAYGLRHIKENGTQGLEQIFNSYKLVERPHLEKNLGFLATVGSNAPYLGLLGTVLGIMKAFNDLASAPGMGNESVMAGIAHALVATAVGLLVAIPAVVAFNTFQKQVRSILLGIDSVKELCLAYAMRADRKELLTKTN